MRNPAAELVLNLTVATIKSAGPRAPPTLPSRPIAIAAFFQAGSFEAGRAPGRGCHAASMAPGRLGKGHGPPESPAAPRPPPICPCWGDKEIPKFALVSLVA